MASWQVGAWAIEREREKMRTPARVFMFVCLKYRILERSGFIIFYYYSLEVGRGRFACDLVSQSKLQQ